MDSYSHPNPNAQGEKELEKLTFKLFSTGITRISERYQNADINEKNLIMLSAMYYAYELSIDGFWELFDYSEKSIDDSIRHMLEYLGKRKVSSNRVVCTCIARAIGFYYSLKVKRQKEIAASDESIEDEAETSEKTQVIGTDHNVTVPPKPTSEDWDKFCFCYSCIENYEWFKLELSKYEETKELKDR
ncbi:hypothetical protein H4219_002032 [Mycoemilia scoparia]|uniref:Uncharacterized protein n=1 Tax=Mycoemilia scoparia TaxID=417184 RepID=A0A9W7ZZF3_9FUNG|nr:hypothetical protein H4219_002032 [Mycoemilia scoparia]